MALIPAAEKGGLKLYHGSVGRMLQNKKYLGDDLLWSSVFVTLMAKKYRFMQFELDMVFDTH